MSGPPVRPLIGLPAPSRSLSEAAAVALAVATWFGAWLSRPLPAAIGIGVVLLAFAWRRPVLLIIGVGLLASSLAASAWAGLVPVSARPFTGSVLLVSDPASGLGGVRADVKLDDGSRVELWARGGPARSIGDLLAGERLDVRGDLEPPPDDAMWLAVRHVVGRLTVTEVRSAPEPNDPPARVANAYRRLLATGAYALPAEQRPLFLGFVLGDDRGQDPALVDDFRGSGLSHLLAVSGQNVAFLLLVARPVLLRLAMPARLAVTLTLLGWFAMLTRFEPSVLRATAMAAVAALAVFRGVPVSPVRALSLAVAGLLLVDPLLQASVGFRLSVGAAAGIVLLAARISVVLPGPTALRQAMAVTVAAQAGVAPVLVSTFGGVPPVSLVANLLAVPAAGPVMMWGLTAGAVAGLAGPVGGGALSRLVHLPTRLLLSWVAFVARTAASAPLGTASLLPVVMAAAAGTLFVLTRRWGRHAVAGLAAIGFVLAILSPSLALRTNGSEMVSVADGARLWRSTDVAVLVVDQATARPADVLEGVRRRGIGRLDLVVSASGSAAADALIASVRQRVDIGDLWQPVDGSLTGARTPEIGTFDVGAVRVFVRENDPKVIVDVTGPP
ncbi:MAG: ComEC/Rec2 family competence protein [Actinobacteria bacterium]|nr:ComEC/Rec2 family competence protein [Actinomycetota bacterium]